jgi:hypothetical protein
MEGLDRKETLELRELIGRKKRGRLSQYDIELMEAAVKEDPTLIDKAKEAAANPQKKMKTESKWLSKTAPSPRSSHEVRSCWWAVIASIQPMVPQHYWQT